MRSLAVGLAVAAALLAACGGSGSGARPPKSEGPITVLAAASLSEPFEQLARRFERAHPGAAVSLSFGASSALVAQLVAGAPADVLATADERTMHEAVEAGVVLAPTAFARNRLALLVAPGNPERIQGLADLARPGLVVVLCASEVPCGRLGAEVLERAAVQVRPRSLEPNVKGVVRRVVLGEADAGLVYATDVKGAGHQAQGIDIPPEHNAVTEYSVAAGRRSPHAETAGAFVAFVRSDEGRAVLAAAGFDV